MTISIPIVDFSPFFQEGADDDQAGKKAAMEAIAQACLTTGFFQIVNHGVPVELMSQTFEVLRTFFRQSEEEKGKSKPMLSSESPVPAGYARQPGNLPDKNEYFSMFTPELGWNVYPAQPTEFRPTMDECYTQLSTLALLLGDILNDCMGLPPNFIRDYIKDRQADVMVALHYVPLTDHHEDRTGNSAHRDGNCITLLCQDDVGGLEVLADGEWVPIEPSEGAIIVNIGDIVQVLTNNKFESALHRVVRQAKDRYSFVYFFNTDGEKWIEPLPKFTSDIGEQPVYNGFRYKDYMQLRMRNKTHPPARPEDAIDISHYAVSSLPTI